MSAKGAPHDGQDTVKTLRTIIWYKRACIGQTTRQPSVAVQSLKKDEEKKSRYRTSSELENSVLEINHVRNVTKVLNETTASDRVSRSVSSNVTYAHGSTQHYCTLQPTATILQLIATHCNNTATRCKTPSRAMPHIIVYSVDRFTDRIGALFSLSLQQRHICMLREGSDHIVKRVTANNVTTERSYDFRHLVACVQKRTQNCTKTLRRL